MNRWFARLFRAVCFMAFCALSLRAEPSPSDKLFQWRIPGGRYVDPVSFFSLHGYINGVYGSFSRDWTAPDPAQVGAPGQLLVPNTPQSSFQWDGALFVSSEMSQRTRALLELHLVSDPSGTGAAGPGGLTIVATEANASWDLVPSYLTLSGGLFWAPFGTVNQDWLGAQNLFTLIPRASAAFPTHFNERGVRLTGAKALSEKAGVNYVLSYGNGVQSFDINGQNAVDRNENKTVIGRIGFFPGFGKDLEVGYSFAVGELRHLGDTTKVLGDPLRYPSDMIAHGVDATYRRGDFLLRSYYITSQEHLRQAVATDPSPDDLARQGAMAEASYNISLRGRPLGLKSIAPKFRYDWVDVMNLNTGGVGSSHFPTAVYSWGVSLYPEDKFYLSLEYHWQNELGRPELRNNRAVARLTAMF